jgi:hypothetical protein
LAGVRDYSSTAASNLSVGGISIAEGMARSSVNNAIRATLADTANLLLDQGGSATTTGSGNAFLLSLPTAPTALADNLAFVCKLHHAVTGAATLNINGLGVKSWKKIVNGILTELTGGDAPTGHRASCIYSSSDNAVLMLNAGGAGNVLFVDDIDDARALSDLQVGATIYVGDDQFVVVDDATLGADGGTVFIPNSELSTLQQTAIPTTEFIGSDSQTHEYFLGHAGIDFESVEVVLSDSGETINIWDMHGHVMLPQHADRPSQWPLINTATGMYRDPYSTYSSRTPVNHPPVRTGGILVRYKYALSGLRLKRITGPVFNLRWWPVVAVEDEAPGVQTDNSGKICWAANAAALAKAEAVYIDSMYYYSRCVEWPEGVELRGKGPGLSGFRVMDNAAWKELLLSTSSEAPGPTKEYHFPMDMPATRRWSYDSLYYSNACAFYPANRATRIRISGIEFDGNVAGNMRMFTQKGAEYAYGYAQPSIYFFNTQSYSGFAFSDGGGRVIPEGQVAELHNVKIHGYASHLLLGNQHTTFIGTGVLELGDTLCGHWTYLADGVYETIRCFGYCSNDGLRHRKLIAKSVEMVLAPMPDVMFNLVPYPNSVGTLVADVYKATNMYLVTMSEYVSQYQSATLGFPYPILSKFRIVIDHFFLDATGLDTFPAGTTYEAATPFALSGDNIHIKSGKIRFGSLTQTTSVVLSTSVNNVGGLAPIRNAIFENLHVEYGSRKGVSLYSNNVIDGGWTETQFRNITFEPRAATHLPGDATPSGINVLLGAWRFRELVSSSYSEGRDYEFSGVAADATLNGKYIDITPPDAGAPTYRLWFNYNAAGSAPAAGGTTLIQVPVAAAGVTTARLAYAFSLAVDGTVASPGVAAPYLTAATYGTKSVVGSWSQYHHETNSLVTTDVTHAAGVATALRSFRRNYEPSVISFERFKANDPSYLWLLNLNEVGTNRDIYFTFKDCVFGAYFASLILINGGGNFNAAGSSASDLIKDKVHWSFENCVFDLRDGTTWQILDLFLYAGRFRNCRVRTPAVGTTLTQNAGLTTLGTGYEALFSEDSGVYTVTPGADASSTTTWIDIQTKLFWMAKPGNVRVYPADAATAAVWNTNIPYVEWRRSPRPVNPISVASITLGDDEYYQGSATPSAINEDRRAPVLRLNFASALAASPLKIGWAASVSP